MKKLLIILILVSSCTKEEKYKCSNDVVMHIKDNTIEYSTVVYGGDISKTIIKITEKSKSKLVARYNPLEGLAGGEGIFFQLVFDKIKLNGISSDLIIVYTELFKNNIVKDDEIMKKRGYFYSPNCSK